MILEALVMVAFHAFFFWGGAGGACTPTTSTRPGVNCTVQDQNLQFSLSFQVYNSTTGTTELCAISYSLRRRRRRQSDGGDYLQDSRVSSGATTVGERQIFPKNCSNMGKVSGKKCQLIPRDCRALKVSRVEKNFSVIKMEALFRQDATFSMIGFVLKR